MTFVFRSTAKTIVRCSAPSRLLATIGRTWRRSGRLKRTANVPSLRSLHRLAAERDVGVRMGHAVNDQFGVHLELETGPVGGKSGRPGAELHGRRIADRPLKPLLEHLPQVAVGFRLAVAAAEGEDPIEILGHFGPIPVEGVAGRRRRAC